MILALTLISIAMLIGSALALPIVAVRLPADYFVGPRVRRDEKPRHPAHVIAKNVLGGVLVLAGIAMLILPGQGVLSIVAGLALIDFPGKHRLQRQLLLKSGAHRLLDHWRRRAGREPLRLHERTEDPAED